MRDKGKHSFGRLIITWTFLFLILSSVNNTIEAANRYFFYEAILYPLGLNSGGTPPATSSAIGTFSYDDQSLPNQSGQYPLKGLTFQPAPETEARNLYCIPITVCLEYGGDFANFNPNTLKLDFDMNQGSYSLDYNSNPATTQYYSDNNSWGTWEITTITVVHPVFIPIIQR